VCLLAAPWVQLSVSAGNGWPHNALRHHWLMPISCHFRYCKALLVTSLTHVSGAIASVQTLPFLPLGLPHSSYQCAILSIDTMPLSGTKCEIFDVKEYCDLEVYEFMLHSLKSTDPYRGYMSAVIVWLYFIHF